MMKQHEREFFVTQIRSGVVLYKDLEIRPPSLIDAMKSQHAYKVAYQESLDDGMMQQSELDQYMIDVGLWSKEDALSVSKVEKDIDNFKVEIFNNFYQDHVKAQIKKYLKVARTYWLKKTIEKQDFYASTAEGIAKTEQVLHTIRHCTYKNNKLYNFDGDITEAEVVGAFTDSILSEEQIRHLARNEPWRMLWSIRDEVKLLANTPDQDTTPNQRTLVQWSKIYENIQESMDCPPEEIINDNDALDGWFIVQRKKQEKNKSEKDFDQKVKSDKIKNSSEVFVMARGQKEKERVDNMNSVHGKAIKGQRFNTIKKHGSVGQHQFADEKLKLQSQATQQFRNSVRRR